MRRIVVRAESDLEEVARRVLRDDVGDERVAAFAAELREANPDATKLRPGEVLVLPGGVGLAGLGRRAVERAADALAVAPEHVERALTASTEHATETKKLLRSRELAKQAADDQALGAAVERAGVALEERRRRAQEWAAAMRASTEEWQAALAELDRLP